ncbi:unnamed protein product [Rhizoctonia solani]|uniref:Lysine-specific metallo-endopeptidase domain-containing protein n=1 Tax=Rhizoctonia solani TaxID=456999 RepID=A0A8H3D9S6_9AGAM|nr:unnamed protein product [Rhizoctonia solani]
MRAVFTTALPSAALLGVSAVPSLSLSLFIPESVSDVENFTVTAIVNTGNGTLQLLNDPRSYANDYSPCQSFNLTHNLAGVYNYTNTGAGNFKLDVVSNLFQYINASGNLAMIEASTESKKVGLSGKLVSTLSQIAKAVTAANNVSYASSHLNEISSGTIRYSTWFGTDPSSITYDCSTCTEDAMVYMYADDSSRIYLCGSYWTAESTGTDSQAGTIVHRLSHFTVNGGTEDHVYSQGRAKSLAQSDPAQAIMNAHSHGYFAENTPALS